MDNPIVNFALRGAQILFAVVVLGLSVDLIRGQKGDGSLPGTLGYAAFVGGVSLLGAFIGLASTWIDFLQGVIGATIDSFLIGINLAGGILIAVKLRGVDCSDKSDMNLLELSMKDLINGGWVDTNIGRVGWYAWVDPGKLTTRCKQNQADSAFMFLLVVVLIASATITFLRTRR